MTPLMLASCSTDDISTGDSTLWKGTLAYAPLYGEDYPDYDGEDYYFSAFKSRSAGRASDYEEDIVIGTFTRIPSGGWHLEGFGDIIYHDGYIDVTLDSGEKMQWSATVAPHVEPNVLNNRLCRTWRFTDATIEFLDSNSKVVLTHELTDEEISEEYVDYFTFTRSGRLYEYDHDGDCDRLNWT